MQIDLTDEQAGAYREALRLLTAADVPFIVSGGFAIHYYTGIWRYTKDLDIFLRPADRDTALNALATAGYRTEIVVEHWLAKAFTGDMMVDLITGFGNGLITVDDGWLERAAPIDLLGIETRVVSVTDLIWAKSYVAGRERFDGADIVHLIYRATDRIDWQHLATHFDAHWELLASYLLLYRFVYPEARDHVPDWLMEHIGRRLLADTHDPVPSDLPFRGPLLDRYAYLVDVEEWGLPDPREAVAHERDISVADVREERAADSERYDHGRGDFD